MSLPLGRIKQEVAVDKALISTVLIKLGLWSFIEIPILSLISDLIPFLVLLVKREVAAYEALISPDFDMKLRFWGFIDILNLSDVRIDVPYRWTAPPVTEISVFAVFNWS